MASPESLRERKKQETRRRLRDAAIELFSERGVDNVTVADVANHAQVSVATLFAYVPDGKAALIFEGDENRAEAISATLAGRGNTAVLDTLETFILSRGPFRGSQQSAVSNLIATTTQLRLYARERWQLAAPIVAEALAASEGRSITVEHHALARFALDIPDIAGTDMAPRDAARRLFARLRTGWQPTSTTQPD